jgi:hypothetical protein
MGDKTMSYYKGALQATLALLLLAILAMPVQARITLDALGGELIVEGFLKSETRARLFAGSTHLGQWIQRFQVEASLEYSDIGVFDELAFVVIARPEYDIVQDMGDLSSGRVGEGTTRPSLAGRQVFGPTTDALGWGGFTFAGFGATSTGGIGQLVSQGMVNPAFIAKNFEVDFATDRNGDTHTWTGLFNTRSAFPLVVQKSSNLNLTCNRCVDLNVDNLDVATGNTDSNGRLYPFRELYADAIIGDWWIRLGKQQIVWGKTDFFRLQDLINPVDFGQHFFFDSFEDIRIPQWMMSVQWKAGSIGPLTDNAVQVVWNFDEFQQIGLGNPSHFWAHPFAKDTSTFAIFNTYFSVEPCFTAAGAAAFTAGTSPGARAGTAIPLSDICGTGGPQDRRLPSGFGQPVGLSENFRPDHEIKNTEAGFRWEFRVSDFRVAVSHWWGWNDIPVFRFHSVNMPTRHLTAAAQQANLPNDVLVGDLGLARFIGGVAPAAYVPGYTTGDLLSTAQAEITATGTSTLYLTGGFVDPVIVDTPQNISRLLESSATSLTMRQVAANARISGNYANLWAAIDPILTTTTGSDWNAALAGFGQCAGPTGGLFCSPVAGGQTSQIFKQAHTLGLAVDYFESWSGIVFRIESSWTFDELVNNTRSVDWVDKSDVMRFSIGLDRPTFIPLLNKTRTFFLSLQIFDTWYWDHEGDKNTGYFVDEHNWITTFFFLANYKRDTVKPIGFYVWEEATNSHVAGFNVEWLLTNHWSVKGGFHLIWEGDENTTHDAGPFTNFITSDASFVQDPYVSSVLGPGRQGLGGLRNYDEVFFELKYQF